MLFEGNQDDEDEITISVQFLQPSSGAVTRMVQTKVSYRLLHKNIAPIDGIPTRDMLL